MYDEVIKEAEVGEGSLRMGSQLPASRGKVAGPCVAGPSRASRGLIDREQKKPSSQEMKGTNWERGFFRAQRDSRPL